MASKALKYVGIGCGVFVLIGVVAMVGLGMWAKSKMEGMGEWAGKVEEQNKELQALNSRYAFQPPAEGEPLPLSADQVQRYLAIRTELEPVLAKYQAESKKLEKTEGQQASVSDGLAAFGMMGQLMVELRGAYLEQLKKQRMSPREFLATSTAVYSGIVTPDSPNAKLLEAYKEQIQQHASMGLDALLAVEENDSSN